MIVDPIFASLTLTFNANVTRYRSKSPGIFSRESQWAGDRKCGQRIASGLGGIDLADGVTGPDCCSPQRAGPCRVYCDRVRHLQSACFGEHKLYPISAMSDGISLLGSPKLTARCRCRLSPTCLSHVRKLSA